MSARAVLRAIWFAGGLAIVLGFGREVLLGLIPKPRELPRLDGATGRPWITDGFVSPDRTNQDLQRSELPAGIHVASSWLETDAWQGRAETAWFKASRRIVHVSVAGYPHHLGCRLWAEFRAADGRVTHIDCPLRDPGEQWKVWPIKRPADAIAVRIIAEDRAMDYTGWLAISHPFRVSNLVTALESLQIPTALALVLSLLWGPGLLWCPASAALGRRLLWMIGAGPFALAAAALFVRLFGGLFAPHLLAGAMVSTGWVIIGWRLRQADCVAGLTRAEVRVLAITGCVVLTALAKSFYSTGSHGELARGPWLPLPETWLMPWLPTHLNPVAPTVELPQLDPLHFGLNALALVGAATLLIRARAVTDPKPELEPTEIQLRVPRAAWLIFGLGAAMLLIGPLRISNEEIRPLAPAAVGDAFTGNRGFVSDGVTATDRFEELPPALRVRGSWVRSEDFQGRHVTGWFRAAPKLALYVSGYPLHAGNRLELEVRRASGTLERVLFAVHDVGSAWLRWVPDLPADAEAVRILASDTSTGPGGWLGFSEPFTAHAVPSAQWWALVQLVTATCLVLTLVCGPGLLWFGDKPRPLAALAFAIVPGPLLLAALGVACWVLGGACAPATVARVGVITLLGWMGWRGWQRRGGSEFPREVRFVTTLTALLSGFAVAKANVSFGPPGEVFRNRVSRTLAVGNHPDSQISFHVVQAVAHHLGPYNEQTQLYFAPWRFGSRGPLAGLVAAPIVLATGADVPFDHPTHPWRPFDREGFAVYRIACIALAALAAWAVFGVAATITSSSGGLVATIIAVLAPFFIHEIYFSWPKLIAGAFVLVAFLAAQTGRPFLAGVMLAVGYLYHPLAALSGPFLALWVLRPAAKSAAAPLSHRTQPGRWVRLTRFAVGALVLVIPWQIVGRLRPDGWANQDIFLVYFTLADSTPATWTTWWQSRWGNFANTFLPGYLLTGDGTHDSYGEAVAAVPQNHWVRASFLHWNTLPFALGIPAFVLVAAGVVRAARRRFAVVAVSLLGPALLLIIYWGAATTGLMRQCGHALFLSLIVVGTWSLTAWWDGWPVRAITAFLHPLCFIWRGFEVALMTFGTTWLNHQNPPSELYYLNDAISLTVAATCLAALVVQVAATGRQIAREYVPQTFQSSTAQPLA